MKKKKQKDQYIVFNMIRRVTENVSLADDKVALSLWHPSTQYLFAYLTICIAVTVVGDKEGQDKAFLLRELTVLMKC